MSNFISALILATPIALLPLVHLVTSCEGIALVILTVLVQIALLLLTLFLETSNEELN